MDKKRVGITGMGVVAPTSLSIVHTIVTDHGGASTSSFGTCCSLEFPLSGRQDIKRTKVTSISR